MMAGKFVKVLPDVPHPRIPMAIFTSQSKAPHFDAQEMHRVTQIGIDFYENFFGVKYPFTKYDQIFLPEFRIGGMENAGCVTYNDVLIKP
jgi:aminopeptidase N